MSNTRRTRVRERAAARAVAALAASLTLGACALSANRPPPAEESAEELRVVRYAVEPGDRLSVLAREFTGDMALWRTIADLNGIDDPRRLSVGQVLEIPVALIPEADREARLAASLPTEADGEEAADNAATRLSALRGKAPEPVAVQASPPVASPPAPAASGRAVRVASEPVVVSAVRSREAFELSPLDAGGEVAAGSRFVQVTGSYTPKGVYEGPSGQSRVLMRLTPGTVLPLERRVDGWYRVATTAGPGYVRDGDARVLEPDAAGTTGPGDAAGG